MCHLWFNHTGGFKINLHISRVRRSKSVARKTYDQFSRFYDLLAGSSEAPFMRLGVQMLGMQPGESVLEIGCGTGKALSDLYHQAGEPRLACGLDLSPGMLKMANHNMGEAELSSHAHLLCGDGAALPFAPGSFEAIFMSFTLELFDTPEIPQVLEECRRVLKPGGRLGVVAMSKPVHASPVVRLYEWFHARFPSYVDCRPINAEYLIQAVGFNLQKRQSGNMWGLPVEVVLATKAL